MQRGLSRQRGATILGYEVKDLSAFGAVTLAPDGTPMSLVEKPKGPISGLAVPGLYFYDEQALDIAARQKPSGRGEMEITDVNRAYLEMGELNVERIQRGIAWLDGGTPDDLFEAGQFVRVLEERTGMRIACPEEVAFRKGFIGVDGLRAAIVACRAANTGPYLEMIADSVQVRPDRTQTGDSVEPMMTLVKDRVGGDTSTPRSWHCLRRLARSRA